MIKRKGRRRARGRACRIASAARASTLAAAALSACQRQRRDRAGDPELPTLPDTSGATEQAISNCNAQSGWQVTDLVPVLPQGLRRAAAAAVRRLVAARRLDRHPRPRRDLGGRFAEAGLIVPWTGTYKGAAEAGHP